MSDYSHVQDLESFFEELSHIIEMWDEDEVIGSSDAMEMVRDLTEAFQTNTKAL